MAFLRMVSCRLAIQVCIGHFDDGRERRRTFSLSGVRPDADAEAMATVVRAVAKLLKGPITKVRRVTRFTLVMDDGDNESETTKAAETGTAAQPQSAGAMSFNPYLRSAPSPVPAADCFPICPAQIPDKDPTQKNCPT
jgi:hypothetical protein